MEEIEKNIVQYMASMIKENHEIIDSRVIWIPEIWNSRHGHCGEALVGLLKRLTIKALKQVYEFEHVIEITPQPPKTIGSLYSHAREQRMIAQSLGILAEENGRLQMLLERQDEMDDYRYLDDGVEKRGLMPELSKKIYEKLRDKNYLLVFEHLEQPIRETILIETWLPPPTPWNQNTWLIITPSLDIFRENRSSNDFIVGYLDRIKTLLLLEASDIISSLVSPLINCEADYITQASEAVLECLIYCLLFSQNIDTEDDYGIQEDHLIKCSIGEGFITKLTNTDQGKIINGEEQQQQQGGQVEEETASILFDVGKILLEKFVSRSLLRRHSPRHDQNVVHPRIEATSVIRFAYSELQSESFEMVIYSEQQDGLCRLERWENKKQISFVGSNRVKLQSFLPQNPKLTTLILEGCSALKNISDDFFQLVPCLRVLDLSYTDLTYLPFSIFCLHDLMLLSLRGCSGLTTITSSPSSSSDYSSLPSPKHTLHSLQILDLSYLNLESLSLNLYMPNLTDLLLVDCVCLKEPPLFLESLTNLQVFCLTGSLITTFQESTFSCMESLRVVDLSNNHQLVSLPGSLSEAKRLEELRVNNCKALKDIKPIGGAKIRILSLTNIHCLTSLSESFLAMDSLEELYIKGCWALKQIKMAGNTKIRSFFLFGSPIVELSLRGCNNLETINLNDLEEVEFLDLSFTRINEFPAEIFDLPKLRQFDMVGVPQLRRFPWHVIRRLPKEFNLDHCSCDPRSNNSTTLERQDQSQQPNEDKVRARIFVDDPRFFCSLNRKACERLIKNVEFLTQFHVTISPCDDPEICNRTSSNGKRETAAPRGYCRPTQSRNFPYTDICSKATYVKHKEEEHRPNRHLCRHLTVRRVDRFPPGRQFWLFNYIDSLSMTDVGSLVSLSTNEIDMSFLKECHLDKCHDMEYVVVANGNDQMSQLEILRVSSLVKLKVLFQKGNSLFGVEEFRNLKHVHLEHCRRLKEIFPSNSSLDSLETLTIKSCDNLWKVFYSQLFEDTRPKQRLHTIVLSELPKLLYFSDMEEVRLPALKVLQVRGCWSLCRLPLLGKLSEYPNQVVDVSGEQKWWDKLKWYHYHYGVDNGLPSRSRIHFKPQSNFVSAKPTVRGRVLTRKTT